MFTHKKKLQQKKSLVKKELRLKKRVNNGKIG